MVVFCFFFRPSQYNMITYFQGYVDMSFRQNDDTANLQEQQNNANATLTTSAILFPIVAALALVAGYANSHTPPACLQFSASCFLIHVYCPFACCLHNLRTTRHDVDLRVFLKTKCVSACACTCLSPCLTRTPGCTPASSGVGEYNVARMWLSFLLMTCALCDMYGCIPGTDRWP